MMNFAKTREFYSMSHERLMRARRLYGFICSSAINKSPEIIHLVAERAAKRGLYSENTELKSVKFSLCRHAYKYSKEFDCIGGFGWYRWIDKNGDVWNKQPRYNKLGLLIVRILS